MRGRRLNSSLAHQILRKRLYMGEFDFDGTVYQGIHEPLVTRERWNRVQELLDGKDGFYEEVFDHLRLPHQPVHWETDRKPLLPGMTSARTAEIAKEAGIMQMINAYRVRGHLIADLDPLGHEPSYHPELDPETYGLTIWDLDREFLTGSLGDFLDRHELVAVAAFFDRVIWEVSARADARLKPFPQMILRMDAVCESALISFQASWPRAKKASTISGSNSSPRPAAITLRAVWAGRAERYGR